MSREFSAITACTAWMSTEAASYRASCFCTRVSIWTTSLYGSTTCRPLESGSFSTLPNTVTTPMWPASTTTKLDSTTMSSPTNTPATCTARPIATSGSRDRVASRTCAAVETRSRPTRRPPTINTAAKISLPICLSCGSGLAQIVAAWLDAIDEDFLAHGGVGPPVDEVLLDPSRDEPQIALGLAACLAIAIEYVEQYARGLGRGRRAAQPYGLRRRRAHLGRRLVARRHQAGGETGGRHGGLLRPLVAPRAVGVHLSRALVLERRRFQIGGGGAGHQEEQCGGDQRRLRHRCRHPRASASDPGSTACRSSATA